ncbi:hypothetical protein G3A_07545 [Bacillus sp. 17376]|nr:hypothetical protein G3A_07545 [Bacillus sp. 17376]
MAAGKITMVLALKWICAEKRLVAEDWHNQSFIQRNSGVNEEPTTEKTIIF